MSNFEGMSNVQVAIIPQGTVINGNVEITGKLEMYGTINGDINSNDRVNICGDVKGNIKAKDIYTKDSFVEGNIQCEDGAVVRENTVILGDINAQSLMVDGAIQGKLDIKGMVTVGEKAIVDSDIKAKSIQVNNGAALNGHCSLCYAEITPKNFFTEDKAPAKENNKKNGKK
ncbi:MAG: polymer-forming cytoskeletal protein [Lachnospiraceae bacterium]|nr:polymer-forming cytoskeletal protein [Lachnospiraceae bacterium]MBQ6994078.1 polymer-forming cytoskeletal protein [Lachnospiraceae bacterium]